MKSKVLNTLLLFTLATFSSQGATYYFSRAGNDNNSGTSTSSPWKTFAKLESHPFQPGDVIKFRRGDYWGSTAYFNRGGSSGNHIRVDVYGSGSSRVRFKAVRVNANYVHLKNILVTPGSGSSGIEYRGNGGIIESCYIDGDRGLGILASGSDIRVEGNTVLKSGLYGIRGVGNNITVKSCTVRDTVNPNPSGIAAHGIGISVSGDSGILIERNRVDITGGAGLGFKGLNSVVSENVITGFCQTIDDFGGIYIWSPDIDANLFGGSVIKRNIVIGPYTNGTSAPEKIQGIYMDDRVNSVTITYNTVMYCQRGIFLHNNRDMTVTYNNLYMNVLAGLYLGNDDNDPRNDINRVTNLDCSNNQVFTWSSSGTDFFVSSPSTRWQVGDWNHNDYFNPRSSKVAKRVLNNNQTTTYDLGQWRSASGQEAQSTSDNVSWSSNLSTIYYNNSSESKTFSFSGSKRSLSGTVFNGSVSVPPYRSRILVPN